MLPPWYFLKSGLTHNNGIHLCENGNLSIQSRRHMQYALHIAPYMVMMPETLQEFPAFEIISVRETRGADNRGGF